MAKVFLSFLGTNTYIQCNYVLEDVKVKNVYFIQEGLLKLLSHKFTDKTEDRIIIFLTPTAKDCNWKSTTDFEGLEKRIKKLNLPVSIEAVTIPEGKTEAEIWAIFQIVYDQIKIEDEIYLDVTHGFRSLPMLAIVLLSYSHFLKKTKVKGIYYGAFEALGQLNKVKELPLSERNAPVFELTPFHTLQMWSGAAENFIKLGDTTTVSNLLYTGLAPILKQTKGGDAQAVNEKQFAVGFDKVGKIYHTVRGKQLYEGLEHDKLKRQIQKIENAQLTISPLRPLLSEVGKELEKHRINSFQNCFVGVKWCIDHSYIQQGITLLQESIISIILDDIGEEWRGCESSGFEPIVLENRALVSRYINYKMKNKNKEDDLPEWVKKQENKHLIILLDQSKAFNFFAKIYDGLRECRNNINHGGFVKEIKPGNFESQLRGAYKASIEWFQESL